MVALRIPDIASFLFNEITKWYSFDETLIYKYLFPNGAELQYKKRPPPLSLSSVSGQFYLCKLRVFLNFRLMNCGPVGSNCKKENVRAWPCLKKNVVGVGHRRRMETEAKANVVDSVWGEDFFQFLAALAILPGTILKNGMNSSFYLKSFWCNSYYYSKSS